MELLNTYNLERTADFILWLNNTQQEEYLRETWLHSQSGLSYEKWKQKHLKNSKQSKRKKIDEQKEKEALDNASRILGKQLGGDDD